MKGPIKLLKKRRVGIEDVFGVINIGKLKRTIETKLISALKNVFGTDFNGTNFAPSFHFKTHLLKTTTKICSKTCKCHKVFVQA